MSPGRNDPCPCGSGKKYKKCCEADAAAAAPKVARPATGPEPAECQQLVALLQTGQLAALEGRARTLLARHPQSGFLWNVLGAALGMQGGDALGALEKARQFLPQDPDVLSNLGIAFAERGRYEEAEDCCRSALAARPAFANAHVNLGNVLGARARFAEAEASYRRALRLQPDHAAAHGGLGDVLVRLGRPADAEVHLRRALEIDPDHTKAHSSLLFVHNLLPGVAPAEVLEEARRYGERAAARAKPFAEWANVPDPRRRLRIGLVSGDLGAHPVGYFLESALAAAARRAEGDLEFVAYAERMFADPVGERLRACCSAVIPTARLDDRALAQRIHGDRIDVLVDLAGHTSHNRLPVFAWRPAPVQATWLGYFATTGVAAVDWLIADPWTLPEGGEAAFVERIRRLPETRLCFTPPAGDVAVGPLPALAGGRVTFGCFQSLAKTNDGVVAVWSRVLAAVPNSRLLLKAPQLGEPAVRRSTMERFAAHGIGAERLQLEEAEPRAQYLAAYGRVDLALDPFPFAGATTSAEGLWMGVPMVTLAGDRFVSRQGVSLLQNLGMPEWIAADPDDYVARAVRHANDLPRLVSLRAGLRQRLLASPCCDATRFARHFADALRGMWQDWCARRNG